MLKTTGENNFCGFRTDFLLFSFSLRVTISKIFHENVGAYRYVDDILLQIRYHTLSDGWENSSRKIAIKQCRSFLFMLNYDIVTSHMLYTHWTYWLQILSKLCFQRVALSGNYEILAICTDKNTFFNELDYKADPGQHFHKSKKSARRRHRQKIIKTNLKTLVSPLLTRT